MTFIVRIRIDASGRLAGVVESAKTGAKQAFRDATALGPLIERMAATDAGGEADPTDEPDRRQA